MSAAEGRHTHGRSWRWLGMVTGVLASVVFAAGTAAAAPAAVSGTARAASPSIACGPSGCGDPKATGCWDGNAYVASSTKIYDKFGDYLGYVDNWYSPDCGTNWSEVIVDGGVSTNLTVYVYNGTEQSATYTTYGYSAWSDQIYSPTTTAYAYGAIYNNSNINGSAIASA